VTTGAVYASEKHLVRIGLPPKGQPKVSNVSPKIKNESKIALDKSFDNLTLPGNAPFSPSALSQLQKALKRLIDERKSMILGEDLSNK